MLIEKTVLAWTLALVLPAASSLAAGQTGEVTTDPEATPATYVADFVATAASGADMNEAGDITGTSYRDTGCGPFCLPPLDTVVWRDGVRIVLPEVPGLTGISVGAINAQGWVAGFAGFPGTITHAIVWKPNGSTYDAIDLGVLPGTTISYAMGIDDLGRVVGWSTTSNFPPNGSPFVWSESTGMVDLATQGFPDEPPLAISPGGAVATQLTWYRLGNPNSVVPMPSAPQGFVVGTESTSINDDGDQARFLISTGPQNLRYLFRFHHEGTWQQISLNGTGHLSRYGVGSINAARDVSATVGSTGVIATGPDGLAQPLTPLLSPAYQGSEIAHGGPMNSAGQILSQVMIGRSVRVVRLVPAVSCNTDCIRVSSLTMRGIFVEDPSDPGHCTPEGKAYNLVSAKLTVTDETGIKLGGVLVRGRFLDDYWTDKPVSATTNAQGTVSFINKGLCGVGAVAFLVDSATKQSQGLDRTAGIVAGFLIPLPGLPPSTWRPTTPER